MIAQLNGKIVSKTATEVIIDCGGVGYSVIVPVITSNAMPAQGETARLFTVLVHNEDSMTLYGFASTAEKEAFKLLTSVSGIGAKMSITILSSVSIGELQEHIIRGNIIALSKIPGIGKKTAERLSLELKDKILKISLDSGQIPSGINLLHQEAISALVTLGYNKIIAEKAVNKAVNEVGDGADTEQIIRLALKFAMV